MREISRIRRQLNSKNKSVLGKVVNYIYAHGVNTIVWKEIRVDLARMLLESQKRGEDSESVIGSDYKAFCDDLIENCPRKTSIDVVIELLFIIGISVSIIVPMIYFCGKISPSINSYVDGVFYYASLRGFSLLIAGAFGGGIGSFLTQKYAFSKKRIILNILLYLVTYSSICLILLTYLKNQMRPGELLRIDMLKTEQVALLVSMILFLIRAWRTKVQINKF